MKAKSFIGILSFGTVLEWAEFTFYGYMAITLSALFFPEQQPHLALLKTYGIFAVGFIMRPLGAMVFGHVGDRFGRKPALVGSIALMGFATLGIGCLPTYGALGSLAPLLLLVFRMLQGLAISGEYNGAGIFLVEQSKNHFPCLAGSWISASAALGMVLGGLAAFGVSYPGMPEWAWRVPFLLGGVSCLIGFWLRQQIMISTAVFHPQPKQSQPTLPLKAVLLQNKQALLLTGAIAAFTGVFVYINNVYIVVYLHHTIGLPTHHASFFAIFGETLVALLIPCMALLADYTCPYRQYQWGLLGAIVLCPMIFLLCATGNYGAIFCAMALYGILNGILCGPMMKILTDQFPAHLRYTGISVGWSLSAAIFAGTAPMVAEWLNTACHLPLAPSFYVSLIALVAYGIIHWCLLKTVPLTQPRKSPCNVYSA